MACTGGAARGRPRCACAVAKARTSEAAVTVAAIAHAVHGAIGITEEFDLQLYTRRLHAWRVGGRLRVVLARCASGAPLLGRPARRRCPISCDAPLAARPADGTPPESKRDPMAFLHYEQSGAVVTLTMNQPETRNALTGNTAVDEFVDACARIAADASVRVVILTGAGPVFSSGGNVKDMRRFFDDDAPPEAIREEYRHGIQRLALAVYNLDVPAIAAVNGPAIGAGCDLACMCDIRIAADSATLRRELRQGRHRAGRRRRLAAAARGRRVARRPRWRSPARPIGAQEALACGLVSRVVPGAELMAEAAGARAAHRASTRARRCA